MLNIYLQKIKGITDALAAIDDPVRDREMVSAALVGLGPEYESFQTAILNR